MNTPTTGSSRLKIADAVEEAENQLIDELEARARRTEAWPWQAVGLRGRLRALVRSLVETLRLGRAEHGGSIVDSIGDVDTLERGLLCACLVERVEQGRLSASPAELVLISRWVWTAERARVSEENRRLRALLDRVDDDAALLGPEARVLYVNRRAAQSLRDEVGVAPENIVGKTPSELGVPEDLVIGGSPERMLEIARAGDSFEVVAAGRTKENNLSAIYGPEGDVAAVALVVKDIHERTLAHRRVEVLDKLARHIGTVEYDELAEALANVPVPHLADWCMVNIIDDAQIRQTFLANHDPAKTSIRDALAREGSLQWDRHPLWQEMLTGGFQLLHQVHDDLVRKVTNSEEQYKLVSALGIQSVMVLPLTSRGRIAGLVTFAYTTESGRRYGRDDFLLAEELAVHAAHMIENARLMKELRLSEARFRVALSGARTMVYAQDRSLRYVWYYNPMVPGSHVGDTHEDAFPPEEAAFLTKMKQHVLDTGESLYDEADLKLKGDERRHYRMAAEPLRNRSGKIVGVTGAATDITEQQRTRVALTEEVAFREQIMGVLCHDLRNPVCAISMADGLLLRDGALPASIRDSLLRIQRSADRITNMIDALFDFTRTRFLGGLPVSRVPVDLSKIAQGVIDEFRDAQPDREVRLEVRGDPRGAWDPGRIAQAISNLVGNAVAYGARATPVRVTIDSDSADATLKINNAGPPIPDALMPILFEPFRRGTQQRATRSGLGLGLYIVRQIVSAHRGTIGVTSTLDEGTTFVVTLPRAVA
jgi:PAS domain S-box-containing protein